MPTPEQENALRQLYSTIGEAGLVAKSEMSTLGSVTPQQQQAFRQRQAMRQAGQMGRQTAGAMDQGLRQAAAQKMAQQRPPVPQSDPRDDRMLIEDQFGELDVDSEAEGSKKYAQGQWDYKNVLAFRYADKYDRDVGDVTDDEIQVYESTLEPWDRVDTFMAAMTPGRDSAHAIEWRDKRDRDQALRDRARQAMMARGGRGALEAGQQTSPNIRQVFPSEQTRNSSPHIAQVLPPERRAVPGTRWPGGRTSSPGIREVMSGGQMNSPGIQRVIYGE